MAIALWYHTAGMAVIIMGISFVLATIMSLLLRPQEVLIGRILAHAGLTALLWVIVVRVLDLTKLYDLGFSVSELALVAILGFVFTVIGLVFMHFQTRTRRSQAVESENQDD